MLHPDQQRTPLDWGLPRRRIRPADWQAEWQETPLPPGWWLAPAALIGAMLWASGAAALLAVLGS